MKIIAIVLIILILLYLLLTYFMFVLISKKSTNNILPMSKAVTKALEPYAKQIEKGNKWIEDKYKKNEVKDIYITSNDNLKLHAILIGPKNSKGIIIETHGYRSVASRDLYPSCFNYYDMGYSLLIVDNRASNLSEGKYITFGIRESEDVINWVKYVNKTFHKQDIILAGISMGASSILMSLKDVTKKMNIKYVIADCGYVSAYEEVLYCIKQFFQLNGKLFIGMIDIWCKLIAKFSLKEKDTISSLSNVKIPILFIHGTDDDFVPTINSINNYKQFNGPKELVLFDNTTHGLSYLVDSKKYIKSIKEFISK